MRIPVDFAVDSRTISFTLVAIVEPIQLSVADDERRKALHTCIRDPCRQQQQTE